MVCRANAQGPEKWVGFCVLCKMLLWEVWGGGKDKKDLCPSDAYSICFLLLRENVISKDLRYYMSSNIQIQ